MDRDSNAVNTASSFACPETDQRGRKRDDQCDVGAFEYVEDGDFFIILLQGNKAVVVPGA
ncbi:hypothetical protein N8855_00885 [bacterium]|nr:hypothetical protein [bacterium]